MTVTGDECQNAPFQIAVWIHTGCYNMFRFQSLTIYESMW